MNPLQLWDVCVCTYVYVYKPTDRAGFYQMNSMILRVGVDFLKGGVALCQSPREKVGTYMNSQ